MIFTALCCLSRAASSGSLGSSWMSSDGAAQSFSCSCAAAKGAMRMAPMSSSAALMRRIIALMRAKGPDTRPGTGRLVTLHRPIPSDEGSRGDHQREADDVHGDLHWQSAGPFGEREVAEHRQENAETENLKRMLPAQDDRTRQSPAQESAVGGDKVDGHNRESKETDQADRYEIGLVDRPKRLQQEGGEWVVDPVDRPTQIYNQR